MGTIGVSRCFHLECYPYTSTKSGIAVDVSESLIVKLRDCCLSFAKSCCPDNAAALVLNWLKRRLVRRLPYLIYSTLPLDPSPRWFSTTLTLWSKRPMYQTLVSMACASSPARIALPLIETRARDRGSQSPRLMPCRRRCRAAPHLYQLTWHWSQWETTLRKA